MAIMDENDNVRPNPMNTKEEESKSKLKLIGLDELKTSQNEFMDIILNEIDDFHLKTLKPYKEMKSTFKQGTIYLNKIKKIQLQMKNIEKRVLSLKKKAKELQTYATPHDIVEVPNHEKKNIPSYTFTNT